MEISEFLAWLGACALIGPILYFQIFGEPNEKYRNQGIFGIKITFQGNSSAVIPKKLILSTFGVAFSLFAAALALYHYGF